MATYYFSRWNIKLYLWDVFPTQVGSSWHEAGKGRSQLYIQPSHDLRWQRQSHPQCMTHNAARALPSSQHTGQREQRNAWEPFTCQAWKHLHYVCPRLIASTSHRAQVRCRCFWEMSSTSQQHRKEHSQHFCTHSLCSMDSAIPKPVGKCHRSSAVPPDPETQAWLCYI